MVIMYKIIGYIGIISGIIILILSPIFNITTPIYTMVGGPSAIIYGIIALVKASYFERLETITAQTRANTRLILDQLNQQNATPPPTEAADPLDTWKPSK
ncbi:MAG: hypothetical protein IJ662_09645 [Clostridia bacterium]|nr:hypothetical protein [Clostridia bacterium]